MLRERQGPSVWKGSSQAWLEPYRPLLTPSTAPHSRVQPSGLISALTGWLTRPICMRATFTWAPGMCLSGRELSRFKGWRHNTIYLFTLYTGACHFINICISFLVPCSILGSVSLVLGTKISLKSLHCCMVLSHEGHKHMWNIKYDLYTCVSNI